MFRSTKEPSSGGEHLCLAKVTCGSMVLVHMNSVSIVAAYIYIYILTEFTWTSTIERHVTLSRHRCSPPEDGSFVSRNMSGLFLYVILYFTSMVPCITYQ